MTESRSPLSVEAQALVVQAQAWAGREQKLREQRTQVLVDLQAARSRYEALLGEQIAGEGTLTEAMRKRTRAESGLGELEEQLEALEHALRAMPELRRGAYAKAQHAAEKEKRQALDRLQREWLALVRKELLPKLRELRVFLAEAERIALEAKRWSQEGEKPGDFLGRHFPLSPLSLAGLVRYLFAMHGGELER